MGDNTKIEWVHHTFNPWLGCTKVGPGCDNCYAEAWAKRYGLVKWGFRQERRRTTPANWRKPLAWNAEAKRLGTRYRVFCASLADVFDNSVPPEWRADLFHLIRETPHLDWAILTKRIGNTKKLLPWATDNGQPYLNVWIGATVCNQEEADRDIPKLLDVPARVRFLSIEPLLGPVELPFDRLREWNHTALLNPQGHAASNIDWVIVGGESGPKARPMHPDWAYSLRDQCEAAGVPLLFKQWGEWANAGNRAFGTAKGEVRHIQSDGSFWGDDLPDDENADVITVVKVGKKSAGRLLGGVLHDGYPEI